MKKQTKGFTLLELIVIISIIAILATIATPSFSHMLAKHRLNVVVAEWRSAFYLAQKEAIRTKKEVRLCPSTNGISCDNGDVDYSKGWLVLSHDNKVIRDYPRISDNDIKLNIRNGGKLSFSSNGRLPASFAGANVVFEAGHDKYADIKVKLKIGRSGRIEKG